MKEKKQNSGPELSFPPSLSAVAGQIGDLVSHSGFDPVLGRIWTVLLLAEEPLGAREIGKALKAPPKKVLASLAEMERWGSVTADRSRTGEPRWSPELNPLKMTVRVLREREVPGMESLSARLKEAQADPAVRSFARDRLRLIEEILRVSHIIMEIMLMLTQLDTAALKRARDAISAVTRGLGGVLGRLRGFRD
jgi:DNA-binding transcriptional regulator GbsR (MarR family)